MAWVPGFKAEWNHTSWYTIKKYMYAYKIGMECILICVRPEVYKLAKHDLPIPGVVSTST